jgi:hypothetical protein
MFGTVSILKVLISTQSFSRIFGTERKVFHAYLVRTVTHIWYGILYLSYIFKIPISSEFLVALIELAKRKRTAQKPR